MSQTGRENTAAGIIGLVKALASIREDVIRATADGHIDKDEAMQIFSELGIALIHEGLQVALMVAQNRAGE